MWDGETREHPCDHEEECHQLGSNDSEAPITHDQAWSEAKSHVLLFMHSTCDSWRASKQRQCRWLLLLTSSTDWEHLRGFSTGKISSQTKACNEPHCERKEIEKHMNRKVIYWHMNWSQAYQRSFWITHRVFIYQDWRLCKFGLSHQLVCQPGISGQDKVNDLIQQCWLPTPAILSGDSGAPSRNVKWQLNAWAWLMSHVVFDRTIMNHPYKSSCVLTGDRIREPGVCRKRDQWAEKEMAQK